MKEIGEELKEARELMGLSIDEVAEDLNLKPSQLWDIEAGNREAFKDVFTLKQAIKDYAKYLGLEYEKLEDEFNEFVFTFTSKLSLDAIAQASKEQAKEREKTREIVSPYTKEEKRRKRWPFFLLIFIILGLVIGYFAAKYIENQQDDNKLTTTLFS